MLWLAIFVSVFSFLFYYRHGDVLLYGDAVAHINIARRVFDSKTPGLLQLGTVWLPLPHLLIMPFIVSTTDVAKRRRWLHSVDGRVCIWRDGNISSDAQRSCVATAKWMMSAKLAPGSPPSLRCEPKSDLHAVDRHGRVAVSGIFYMGPGLLRRICPRGKAKALTKCGLCLAAACLTRYDGWFLAAVLVLGAVFVVFSISQLPEDAKHLSAGDLIASVLVSEIRFVRSSRTRALDRI